MAVYGVRITMGDFLGVGTWDHISISLVGSEGESPHLRLDACGKDFSQGAEEEFTIRCPEPVGSLLFLRLHKAPLALPSPLPLAPDAWFCCSVSLTPPEGPPLDFPCYQWLEGACTLALREGTAKLISADSLPVLLEQRQEELRERQKKFRWTDYYPGNPRCLDAKTPKDLDLNLKYSISKDKDFKLQTIPAYVQLQLKELLNHQGPWEKLEDVSRIFIFKKTPMSEYVAEHWKEDEFFTWQFLNGLNPILIRRCSQLPPYLPVTDAMVAPFLGGGTSLAAELEKGTIFLVDYRILEGIPTGQINGRQQYSAAPLCLLHQAPGHPLRPLAIQLSQTPGPDSPIFLPSDSEWDWLLAKTWVRNSELLIHEMVTHLLKTHFIVESFALATLRQLPLCHPIFKSTSLGREGSLQLSAKELATLTYRSFCLPDDLRDRGVYGLQGYYYRDDGLKLWGFPSSLETRAALLRFLTVIIFTCSAQHAAVNSGQFDFSAWMPNVPASMRLPPPTAKGCTPEDFALSLPDVNASCHALALFWGVSDASRDTKPLGSFPDAHFTEEAPRRSQEAFAARLAEISRQIRERNARLPLPYTYLDPANIENSVAI
ncbi:polyunsaturated fatty acid lipoxygenase ALOX15B isoform X3 [Ornithorhynchus anatinus]|uniref:polyunsaturated fatty acid lipoxygenase ALOX15B isoform X3 n=1 Tax=Ornithorhynchus anatinus TaxID=9258 RepID=UPI0010A8F19F|nr:polyunsaturated fatty acid lipoxygenase ALOX15B isoform X3 [Ornithorhynchus anatinus]